MQVVPVPVAAMRLEPALGNGPYEAAARGEIKMLGRSVLLASCQWGALGGAREGTNQALGGVGIGLEPIGVHDGGAVRPARRQGVVRAGWRGLRWWCGSKEGEGALQATEGRQHGARVDIRH